MECTLAGRSVSAMFIVNLINKASAYLDKDRKSDKLKPLMNKLHEDWLMIQPMFDALTANQVESFGYLDMWRLRDAIEKLEDAIDEHEYYKLREKANDQQEVSELGSCFSKMKQVVTSFLTHSGSSLEKLRKAIKDLGRSTARLLEQTNYTHVLRQDCETSFSPVMLNKMFGRHEEMDMIVQWLIKPLDGNAETQDLSWSPLGTKVAALHLRYNLTPEYWCKFLQDIDNFRATTTRDIAVLKISYYSLLPELQVCFRYCSIFRKNHPFRKEELVQTWISSGLISAQFRGEKKENLGELYLARLTAKSFFDRFGGEDDEPAYYVMNDMMYDLAKCVSRGECARLVDSADFRHVNSSVRHINIAGINNFTVGDVKELLRLKKLRTIIVEDCGHVQKEVVSAMAKVVKNSKSLRLLECSLFKRWHFPDGLSGLKHLRYVKISEL
ncbi:putative disease resistance protein At3g14460 [Oryza sativa Japonica Group]|uniref:putative disease resistance protein At3g14460 n=1 Tax=Oryza sativa subsp. japonica TaxID=39947 RepID=UPI00339D0C6E